MHDAFIAYSMVCIYTTISIYYANGKLRGIIAKAERAASNMTAFQEEEKTTFATALS
jgi:hypothetical protein